MTRKEVDAIMDSAQEFETKENYTFQTTGVSKFQAFLAIKPVLEGELYWYALRRGYSETSNLYRFRFDIKALFSSNEPFREFLMNADEREFYKHLSERLTVYRAMTQAEQKGKDFGVSWTLRKEVAESFLNKAVHINSDTVMVNTVIEQMEITKSDVIACILNRKEYEVILFKANKDGY